MRRSWRSGLAVPPRSTFEMRICARAGIHKPSSRPGSPCWSAARSTSSWRRSRVILRRSSSRAVGFLGASLMPFSKLCERRDAHAFFRVWSPASVRCFAHPASKVRCSEGPTETSLHGSTTGAVPRPEGAGNSRLDRLRGRPANSSLHQGRCSTLFRPQDFLALLIRCATAGFQSGQTLRATCK